MQRSKHKIWIEGFRAGSALDSHLPYAAGTPEAKAWLEGWAQGIHARDAASGDSDKPPVSRWREFFKKLLSH